MRPAEPSDYRARLGPGRPIAQLMGGPRRRPHGVHGVSSARSSVAQAGMAAAGRSAGRCSWGVSMDHGAAARQGFKLGLKLRKGDSGGVVAHRCG
jgi:hypothetical protein